MKSNPVLGYVLMFAGIAGIFVGLTSVSRGVLVGWGGVAFGGVLVAVAFGALKAPPTPASKSAAASSAPVARPEGSAE